MFFASTLHFLKLLATALLKQIVHICLEDLAHDIFMPCSVCFEKQINFCQKTMGDRTLLAILAMKPILLHHPPGTTRYSRTQDAKGAGQGVASDLGVWIDRLLVPPRRREQRSRKNVPQNRP